MQEKEIGKITHYFSKLSVGIIKLSDNLKVGDKVHLKGIHDDFAQSVDSIQLEHASVLEAKSGDEVGIKVSGKVHENDTVFKIID